MKQEEKERKRNTGRKNAAKQPTIGPLVCV